MEKTKTAIDRRIFTVFLLFIIAINLCHACYYRHYTNDDAYITFRYSRNLAEGMGPYYNTGEHVEGYTNFSLMLVMALVIRLLGPAAAPAVAKLIGVAFGAASVVMTALLYRILFPSRQHPTQKYLIPFGAFIAAGIVALSPAFALNSTSGLETTMFSFLLAAAVFTNISEIQRDNWLGSGFLFGAALLTRPEGSYLFAVYWIAQAVAASIDTIRTRGDDSSASTIKMLYTSTQIRVLIINALIVTGIFLCHLAFRWWMYDGEWLPNTYYAKLSGSGRKLALLYVYKGLLFPALGYPGGAAACAGYILRRKRLPSYFYPVAALALGSSCLPFITGIDWMLGWRLVIPFLPLMAVLMAGGWVYLGERLLTGSMRISAVAAAALLLALWFNQQTYRTYFHTYTMARAQGYQTGHTALARWMQRKATKGDIIALMDIGIVGYRCSDQVILDLTGLTDRFIAKSEGTFLKKVYDTQYIFDRRPEFIILTLQAPGTSYEPPPPNTQFTCWTPMEYRIGQSPEFRQWYIRKEPAFKQPETWLEEFANQIGAEVIFEHGHPRMYYLLAVFRRQTGGGGM